MSDETPQVPEVPASAPEAAASAVAASPTAPSKKECPSNEEMMKNLIEKAGLNEAEKSALGGSLAKDGAEVVANLIGGSFGNALFGGGEKVVKYSAIKKVIAQGEQDKDPCANEVLGTLKASTPTGMLQNPLSIFKGFGK